MPLLPWKCFELRSVPQLLLLFSFLDSHLSFLGSLGVRHRWPNFAMEPRNVRLGLATDGVNSFGIQRSNWSTWLVAMLNYNILPWLTTKK
jgi:hypothetical protein